nr:hypothetical protein [Blastocatellia bacterium]
TKPLPAADARTADLSDEDEVDGDEAEKVENTEKPIIVGNRPAKQVIAAQPAPKKLVQKTAQSKPSFSPVVITFDRSGAEKATRPRIVKNK